MANHIAATRALLLGCASCALTLTADTQSQSPGKGLELPGHSSFVTPAPDVVPVSDFFRTETSGREIDDLLNGIGILSPGHTEQFYYYHEQQQDLLREQLADPEQRAGLMAERIEKRRLWNLDVGDVLKLDARTERKLLSLLADQQLSLELEPRARVAPPRRTEAVSYTQKINQIIKVIGTARLDDYVDYQRKLVFRLDVRTFDEMLPVGGKLNLDQRTALTDVLYDEVYRPTENMVAFADAPPSASTMTAEEIGRWMKIRSLANDERHLNALEAANRKIVERAAAFLTTEQTRALANWKQRDVDPQRAWVQTQRRDLAIAPDEKLDVPVVRVLPISKDLQLTVKLTVNDKQVMEQLTSVRGGNVAFDAPEGLIVEVHPHLDLGQLCAKIKLYEKVPGGRRLIGADMSSAYYSDVNETVAQGRKGYFIQWSISGTDL